MSVLGRVGVLVASVATMSVVATAYAGDAAKTTGGTEKTQVILGPNSAIDSLYATVRGRHNHLYAFMGNQNVYMYRQHRDGTLSDPREILRRGVPGSFDHCGVHLVGMVYKATPRHWITFYHAERAAPADKGVCNHNDRHTRWTIRRLQTFNAGRTWVKGGLVISQDRSLVRDPSTGTWSYRTDDTGGPRLVVRNGWMYLFYRATNTTSRYQQMSSIARAPVSSLGVPGSWHKWYDGGWRQPGIGGHQSAVEGLPDTARGISYNKYLHEYLSVLVDIHGIVLYQSPDLVHWTELGVAMQTGLDGSSWGHSCDPSVGLPAAYGYGAIIGLHGSDTTSRRRLYVYYMEKPAGGCFDHRYLIRRLVTLRPWGLDEPTGPTWPASVVGGGPWPS